MQSRRNTRMFTADLIVFDFDGVLIDSEILGCQTWSDCLAGHGIAVSLDEMLGYTGRTGPVICKQIEHDFNCKLPGHFLEEVNEAVENLMEEKLQAVQGVHETLKKLDMPVCIASGSRPKRLFQCLRVADLERFFPDGTVFSAHEVKNGKPAPDLFLYAAAKMGKKPENCIVVEDSISGVKAGIAAGMPVFGFTGGSHCKPDHGEKLKNAGVCLTFGDFTQLPELIRDFTR